MSLLLEDALIRLDLRFDEVVPLFKKKSARPMQKRGCNKGLSVVIELQVMAPNWALQRLRVCVCVCAWLTRCTADEAVRVKRQAP